MKHIMLSLILALASFMNLAQANDSPYTNATQNYVYFVIERLKNTEEYLERLLRRLETHQYDAAKEDYIKAHYQYESIRPLVLLFPNLNTLVDRHLDQLPKDPESLDFVGFHALEYELFVNHDPVRAFVETQKLMNNLRIVIKVMQYKNVTCHQMISLLPAFTQQILHNKLTGHDSLYSESSLNEIIANIEGFHLIIQQTQDFLPTHLVQAINQSEDNIYQILMPYKFEDIYRPYRQLKDSDKALLQQETQHLSELLRQAHTIITQQLDDSSLN